jgi:hypothetical protein
VNSYLRAWRMVVLAGVAVNIASGLFALVRPHRLQSTMGLERLEGTAWLRLAGLMLVDVSIFSAIAALNPTRWPILSHLISFERLGSGLFSLQVAAMNPMQSSTRPKAFLPLGLFDTTVSTTGIVLLFLGLREHRRAEEALERDAVRLREDAA